MDLWMDVTCDVINYYQQEENVVYYYYNPNHNEGSLLKLFHVKKLTGNISFALIIRLITYDDDGRYRCYHVPRTKS